MKEKASHRKKFWATLILFGLMGQVAWVVENMYLNVFIYKMFNASASDISLMVGASAVAATLTTLVVGALSDRIGKRKIFISLGYILWGISIFAFSLLNESTLSLIFPTAASVSAIGVTLTVVLDCVMTFFGSSANDAAFNAWLTDSADPSSRGVAEGINAMMPLVAILAVFGGFMAFDLDKSESWSIIFTVIGALTLIIGILGLFIIKEKKTAPSETGYFKNLIYGFRPSTVKANPEFYVFLALFVIFNISIQIFMPYLIIYYEISLGMTDYVFVMAPAIVLASVITALWGRVYDKKGFPFSSAFSIIWLIIGYVILFFTRTKAPVFIGSLLMMSGYLSGAAVFGAKTRELTPLGKAGMLQGVRIFSQVLVPGVIGPFIGKTVLANAEKIVNNDGTESFVPNANIFAAALVPIILLSLILIIYLKTRKPRLDHSLKTPFEDDKSSDWSEYPRPQMKRESYISLCGDWKFSYVQHGNTEHVSNIKVPFPPESRISGCDIGDDFYIGKEYSYSRAFNIEKHGRVILHFGAVDQFCEVFINSKKVGEHTGGYLPFELDITDAVVNGENQIEVTVFDDLDRDLAYGKQRSDRGGMWYTPISGIWQAVWFECVPEGYIKKIKMTPSLNSVKFEIEGGEDEKVITIGTDKYTFRGNEFELSVDKPHLWTPEDPYLYEFTLESGKDKIGSYFALRTLGIKKINGRAYITLNEKPYFFHGLLDQGYYSDGIYTPASPEGYRHDILKMKELGFNMLRKHIKIEPELFYHYCDKYGMIIFQDMVNSGKYSFLVDTALPTAGFKRGISHKASKRRREAFESDATETLDLLHNHPCVVYYTIFNEGWGQYDADRIYKMLKAHDTTRIYDATSGWFAEKESDVTSEHIYFKQLNDKNMKTDPDRPMVLSEFGGYSCKIEGHCFNLDKNYGYSSCKTPEEFEKAFLSLYRDQVIPQLNRGLCATVYTQLSDVEDETNGLITYDRQVVKVQTESMQTLANEIFKAFDGSIST